MGFMTGNVRKLFDSEFYTDIVLRFVDISVSEASFDDSQVSEFEILYYLHLLEGVYLAETEKAPLSSSSLDNILVPLLGCNIELLASTCSKLMRWRFKEINGISMNDSGFDKATWNCMKALYTDRNIHGWKQRNCLSFILRSLSTPNIPPHLVAFIKSDDYWLQVQNALDHDIHEYRKLGLSILKLTIQRLTTGFEASFPNQILQLEARGGI